MNGRLYWRETQRSLLIQIHFSRQWLRIQAGLDKRMEIDIGEKNTVHYIAGVVAET